MNNNDIIIYYDPLMGSFSLQDLLNYLEQLIKDNNENLSILDSILHNGKLDDTDIVSIMNKFDLSYNLKFIVDLLSNRL